MRINHSERLKFAKQKIVNKTNKLCQAVEVISRVLAMQYEREAVDEDIEAIEADVVLARTIIEKANEEITKYTRLEQEVIVSVQENKRRAKEKNRVYEACIDRGIMRPS